MDEACHKEVLLNAKSIYLEISKNVEEQIAEQRTFLNFKFSDEL